MFPRSKFEFDFRTNSAGLSGTNQRHFYQPLTTIEAVQRRQAIFRDLLRPAGYQLMAHFVTAAAETAAKIKQDHHDWTADQQAADLLTALYEQHEQLEKLTEALAHFQPQSLGLQSYRLTSILICRRLRHSSC